MARIDAAGPGTIEIQKDDAKIADVKQLNFEGSVTVTDEGGQKATVDVIEDVYIFDCETGAAVGDWVYADSSNHVAVLTDNSQTYVTGRITSKPTTTTCKVKVQGILGGFTGLSMGNYWLASDGTMTQSAPSGQKVILLGHAISPTVFLIRIQYVGGRS